MEQILENILQEINRASRRMCTNEVPAKYYRAIGTRKADEIIRKHLSGKETDVLHNSGWIPVKERLPKDGQFVLTCGESGWMKTAWYNARLNLWDTGPSLADLRADAVAWMPLPEPCRESEVEKDEENV